MEVPRVRGLTHIFPFSVTCFSRRRNGSTPSKGIDTTEEETSPLLPHLCENEGSPTKEIDTPHFVHHHRIHVECRNVSTPSKGIDTTEEETSPLLPHLCENEGSPTKEIDTDILP